MRLCRVCGSEKLIPWVDLGEQPLANNLTTSQDSSPMKYPLKAVFCLSCSLGQLTEVVDPSEMFISYPFYAGLSKAWQEHCSEIVEDYYPTFKQYPQAYALDIGSNDGTLLNAWTRQGVKAIGVDPSNVPSPHTYRSFWSKDTAEKIVREHGQARIVTAQNVLAHVDDIHAFLEAVRIVLVDGGLFLVEVPQLEILLRDLHFDTIYHEHLSYFSARASQCLFVQHQFDLTTFGSVPTHGGSWRIVGVKRRGYPYVHALTPGVEETEIKEFQTKVLRHLEALRLMDLTRQASFIAPYKPYGYGASAKATVFLNAFKEAFGVNLVEAVIDDTPFKQGRFIPGVGIPILSRVALRVDKPTHLYTFSWNNAEEIKARALEAGFVGKFV